MKTAQPYVETDAEVQGGRPCIAGTSTRVTEVAAAIQNGRSVDDLLERFAERTLTKAEVYAALAYYYDNEDALTKAHADDVEAAAVAEHERLQAIKRRFMGIDPF